MKKFANLYLASVFLIRYLPSCYLIASAFNAGEDMNKFPSLLRLSELSVLFIFTKPAKNIRMLSYPSIIF